MDNYEIEIDYMDDDTEISREFHWEHSYIDDEPAMLLYATNSIGDEVKILFDLESMEEFEVAFLDYLNILREKQ